MTDDTLKWFRDARFGIFIHWGIYAPFGRGEQIMCRDMMPLAEYEPLADDFRPSGGWAERLAAEIADAGAKYAVLTTRHHDGFCLFDTATHDFNAAKRGAKRDLVAEFADAARGAGLRVGFYYSLLNWRWHAYWDPAGYEDEFPAMVEEVHAQVRELMSGYGKIDVLWYDGGMVPGGMAHGMWEEKPIDVEPAEFFRSAELNAMARELQPGILINNRSGVPEDFGTPEQRVSAEGGERAWEACMTLNYAPGWGYLRGSVANKTAGQVIFNLVDAVRLGGNFLLNVGPHGDGSMDGREGEVLRRVGEWLARNGEAIYGTRPEAVYDLSRGHVQGPAFHYGMWTCRGKTAYLTLLYYPGEELKVAKVGPAITSAQLLTTGQALNVERISNRRTLISGLPAESPDPLATVLKVEFEDKPFALPPRDAKWLDGEF
ncbi:MAG: alpha-L-fucosidase [Planctomycetota bacterium]